MDIDECVEEFGICRGGEPAEDHQHLPSPPHKHSNSPSQNQTPPSQRNSPLAGECHNTLGSYYCNCTMEGTVGCVHTCLPQEQCDVFARIHMQEADVTHSY